MGIIIALCGAIHALGALCAFGCMPRAARPAAPKHGMASPASARGGLVLREALGGRVASWFKNRFKGDAVVKVATAEPAKPAPVPVDESALSSSDKRLYATFFKFDKDGDGRIIREEFEAVADELGVSDARVEKLMERFDLDKDGGIDFTEFQAMIAELEACAAEDEYCFVLSDPSTWGKIFEWE